MLTCPYRNQRISILPSGPIPQFPDYVVVPIVHWGTPRCSRATASGSTAAATTARVVARTIVAITAVPSFRPAQGRRPIVNAEHVGIGNLSAHHIAVVLDEVGDSYTLWASKQSFSVIRSHVIFVPRPEQIPSQHSTADSRERNLPRKVKRVRIFL